MATDLTKLISASTTEISNSGDTSITNPLDRATNFKVFLDPTGTAQGVTLTFPDDSTTVIADQPEFLEFELGHPVQSGTEMFTANSETGTIDLHLVAWRRYVA